MEKIGFVSCVKTKGKKAAQAEELYKSPLFQSTRKYVKRCYDRWFILSARYHLLEPSHVIKPYDETMNQKSTLEREKWALHVYKQINNKLSRPSDFRLYFHAGEHYRAFLIRLLKRAGYSCETPLSGLGIGQQLAWYKSMNNDQSCNF